VSTNRGVQRALAIGKLLADVVDLPAASLAACIAGPAVLGAVFRNFQTDWHRLRHGAPSDAAAARPADGSTPQVFQLVQALTEVRTTFGEEPGVVARKKAQYRYTAWGRGALFALSLFAIGASAALVTVNPVLGAVGVVLAVYAARQAYANWRLARENLQNFESGRGAVSPMGADALGHLVYNDRMQRGQMTPSEARRDATRRSMAVRAVSLGASVATGGLGTAAGAVVSEALSIANHVVRGVGSVALPLTDIGKDCRHEAGLAGDARKRGFDYDCAKRWQEFFRLDPQRAFEYREALDFYEVAIGPQFTAENVFKMRIDDGLEVDLRPLLQWTRRTPHLEHLQAWLIRDLADVGRGNWAQRLLADLRTLDGAGSLSRGMTVTAAAVAVAQTAVGLSV
jgi:hypothetical protein